MGVNLQTLQFLCPSFPLELRASLPTGKWQTERFHDYTAAGQWADEYDSVAKAIYIVLNPFDPVVAAGAATDSAVTQRHWLLVDLDPDRPTNTNSTDKELVTAWDVAERVVAYLRNYGWSEPFVCESGNGVHLLYSLRLPNDAHATALVKAVLTHLGDTFDTDACHVDRAVYNAARITKLYGTMARKGPATSERPHRASAVVRWPDVFRAVSLEALEKIATLVKTEATRSKSTARGLYSEADVLAKIETLRTFKMLSSDGKWYNKHQIRCPWIEEHTTSPDSGTIFTFGENGEAGFKCQHSHCSERRWPQFRDHLGIRPIVSDFHLSEAGDAEFFALRYADAVRYDHRRGKWLLFSEHRWAPQDSGQCSRLALEAIRTRLAEGSKIEDSELRLKHIKWAFAGEARWRQLNLLALAENYHPIADVGNQWDLHPWLLGVQNGVVDLRDGQLRTGSPEDRITMQANAAYNPAATCPLWDRTINEIFDGDEALIAYVDRFIGYSLTGETREEVLAMCWGDGANGKGTLMNTVGWLLGDYTDDLPFSAFELQARSSIPNDIAKIAGKRLVTSSETAETQRLNEARVKALTGRDPITARFLHQEYFTFQPVAKFWLATNHKPEVHDDSTGFWRRIHLIPFTQSFVGREDKSLKDKLKEEASGILARLVRGCLDWQKQGLNPPQIVRDATKAYREESDMLAPFFEAMCVLVSGARVQANVLYAAYVRWHRETGQRDAMSQRAFGMRLRKIFMAVEGRQVFYEGIGLRDTTQDEL